MASRSASTPWSAPGGREIGAGIDRTLQSRELVSRLQRSEIYPAYEAAFQGTTGLPLALRSVGSFHSPLVQAKNANPLCRLLASNNKSCAACLRLQQQVEEAAGDAACTLECFAGLSESAVPIRVGDQVIAFLQTGQVLLEPPSAVHFRRILRRLEDLGAVVNRAELEKAYFGTRVVPRAQYAAILRLLTLVAGHLSVLTNQFLVQRTAGEPPAIARARAYIVLHQTEAIPLGEVAKAVNMSAFYFCKTFRKVTGFTFVDYLAHLRVESVKVGLLNPHKRISEAAFEAGFQSLSQFNRVFRRIAGQAPTAYRALVS
jgi:AraC-like DNA-binding protein